VNGPLIVLKEQKTIINVFLCNKKKEIAFIKCAAPYGSVFVRYAVTSALATTAFGGRGQSPAPQDFYKNKN
jgi:hypothetical protein